MQRRSSRRGVRTPVARAPGTGAGADASCCAPPRRAAHSLLRRCGHRYSTAAAAARLHPRRRRSQQVRRSMKTHSAMVRLLTEQCGPAACPADHPSVATPCRPGETRRCLQSAAASAPAARLRAGQRMQKRSRKRTVWPLRRRRKRGIQTRSMTLMVSCHEGPCCARSQAAALAGSALAGRLGRPLLHWPVTHWRASLTCAPLTPACAHDGLGVWRLTVSAGSLPCLPAEEDIESDGDEDVYALLNRAVSQAASRQVRMDAGSLALTNAGLHCCHGLVPDLHAAASRAASCIPASLLSRQPSTLSALPSAGPAVSAAARLDAAHHAPRAGGRTEVSRTAPDGWWWGGCRPTTAAQRVRHSATLLHCLSPPPPAVATPCSMRSAAASLRGAPHPLARQAFPDSNGAGSGSTGANGAGASGSANPAAASPPSSPSGSATRASARRSSSAAAGPAAPEAPATPPAAAPLRPKRLNPAHALLLREARQGSSGGHMLPEQVGCRGAGCRGLQQIAGRGLDSVLARLGLSGGCCTHLAAPLTPHPHPPASCSALTLPPSTACRASPPACLTSAHPVPTLGSSHLRAMCSLVRGRHSLSVVVCCGRPPAGGCWGCVGFHGRALAACSSNRMAHAFCRRL